MYQNTHICINTHIYINTHTPTQVHGGPLPDSKVGAQRLPSVSSLDKNGFVLQSFEEVKDKLSEILNNSKLIEDTSKGAYQMSLKYDWEKVINQWEQVIEELI